MLQGQSILCIYHDGNIDSFLGAWVVWKLFPNATFVQRADYVLPTMLERRDVFVIGAPIPLSYLMEMAPMARHFTVFGQEETFFVEAEVLAPTFPMNATVIYEPQKSLSHSVWDHFRFSSDIHPIFKFVEDRALWLFRYPETRAVTTALMSYPHSFEIWDALLEQHPAESVQTLVDEGKVQLKRLVRDVEYTIRNTQRRINLGGYDVPVANATPFLASDTAIQLAHGEPFAACYWDTREGRQYDLVSMQNGINVSELARPFGGRGSRHSASFRVPRHHPLATV
jgi:uncharacterized protein